MDTIKQLDELLTNHFQAKEPTNDREVLANVHSIIKEYISHSIAVSRESVPDKPNTVYQAKLDNMTPQEMADIGVNLVTVNNSELFWLTSTGQLYLFGDRQSAVDAEYNWLMSSV